MLFLCLFCINVACRHVEWILIACEVAGGPLTIRYLHSVCAFGVVKSHFP